MKNSEILRNLEGCQNELNKVIMAGNTHEWDDNTLDAMECIIDSLDFNFKEMKKNIERMDLQRSMASKR